MEMTVTVAEDQANDKEYFVEGYATTFEPYVLFRDDKDQPVYEQIMKSAFDKAKMDDVILQYDHSGRVFARQSNGTLGLEVRDDGLYVWADLSKTEGSRALYEDIKAGMINKMSWRFFIAPNGDTYDSGTRTFIVSNVREVIDVSAVSIPANSDTSISARKLEVEEVEKRKAEIDQREKEKLKLRLKIEGV